MGMSFASPRLAKAKPSMAWPLACVAGALPAALVESGSPSRTIVHAATICFSAIFFVLCS